MNQSDWSNMKLRVHSFLLLPPPLLPPCFLELFILELIPRAIYLCSDTEGHCRSHPGSSLGMLNKTPLLPKPLAKHKNTNACAPVRDREKKIHEKKPLLLSSGPEVSNEELGGLSCREEGAEHPQDASIQSQNEVKGTQRGTFCHLFTSPLVKPHITQS